MPDSARIRERLDAVVAEMKKLGIWELERPADEAFDRMGAFGMGAMTFEQWLRWVFVERVEALLASDGPWPEESHVATQANCELDGWPEASELVRRLSDLDALFGRE